MQSLCSHTLAFIFRLRGQLVHSGGVAVGLHPGYVVLHQAIQSEQALLGQHELASEFTD